MKKSIMGKICKIFIGSVISLASFSANASPLDSGIKYVNFCNGAMDRKGTAENLLCLGYFVGTMRGYQLGVTDTIISSMEDNPLLISELGKATRNGKVDGFCPRKESELNDGDRLKVVINTIASDKNLHHMPTHSSLMAALSKAFPCKGS